MSTHKELRLAMLGMIKGNGHPYSWSAIINGYNPAAMAQCPYATIPKYLGTQSLESVRIEGARVTHIWTDDPADAPKVAAASLIENIVARPEDVIRHVDAVIIATDDGDDHVRRVAPFIEAGLPVFVDKPMATNVNARLMRPTHTDELNAEVVLPPAAPDGTRYAYERSAVATANIASCDPRSLMLRTLCAHVTAPLGAKESTYTTHSRTCRSRYSESTAP